MVSVNHIPLPDLLLSKYQILPHHTVYSPLLFHNGHVNIAKKKP